MYLCYIWWRFKTKQHEKQQRVQLLRVCVYSNIWLARFPFRLFKLMRCCPLYTYTLVRRLLTMIPHVRPYFIYNKRGRCAAKVQRLSPMYIVQHEKLQYNKRRERMVQEISDMAPVAIAADASAATARISSINRALLANDHTFRCVYSLQWSAAACYATTVTAATNSS